MPDARSLQEQEAFLWQADGLIVVFRADQVNDEALRNDLDWFDHQRGMPVATMGVVTFMDTIPRKRWIQVLQRARAQVGGYLDVVVPCSHDPDELDIILQDTNALLHREVRNRFYASASTLRRKSQESFAQSMRVSLADQFETYVDRVLRNRWIFITFREEIDARLALLRDELRTRCRRFVEDQKNLALARAAALDSAGFDEPAPRHPIAGTAISEFGREVQADLAAITQELFAGLSFEELPAGSPKATLVGHESERDAGMAKAISFKIPPLPQQELAVLCGEAPAGPAPVSPFPEAAIYDPDNPAALPGPAPVDRWVTATEWLPAAAQQAGEALDTWLEQAIGQLRNNLIRSAEQTFRLVHGFLPGEVPLVLMPLEETYGFLNRSPVYVPTPHLPGEHLSPALFLCRMQEPEFVDLWNRQLIRRCFDFVIPRLERQLVEDIENARSQLSEQWAGSRDSIHKRVEVVWKRYGRRLALKSAVKWSVPWISTLMRDRLMDPVQYLARTRINIKAPYDEPVSLFLHHNSDEFLQPIDRPVDRPLTPDQFVVDLVQQKIRKSAAHIWRNKKPILITLPMRRIVRRRTAQAAGVLFGFALLWIMLFGTNNASLTAFLLLALPYVGIAGWLIKRMVDRMYESGSEVQAERVYQQIERVVHERLDELKRHIRAEIRDEDLHDEVLHALREQQTPPAGLYLPYRELIRRLRSMEERKKSRAAGEAA